MNFIFFGTDGDINIGNGKTVSAVALLLKEYMDGKIIYSNIQLKNVEYTPLTPENLFQCLEENEHSVFLLDEIHAILYKNHRINVNCKQHTEIGLCYTLSQFVRQVRKKDATLVATAQSFFDCHFQLRQLMQFKTLCEKFYIDDYGVIRKCESEKNVCSHEFHLIRQTNMRTNKVTILRPEKYYKYYNSNEIVSGWV